eukprot:4995771-Amphidinium_carterae.7
MADQPNARCVPLGSKAPEPRQLAIGLGDGVHPAVFVTNGNKACPKGAVTNGTALDPGGN